MKHLVLTSLAAVCLMAGSAQAVIFKTGTNIPDVPANIASGTVTYVAGSFAACADL